MQYWVHATGDMDPHTKAEFPSDVLTLPFPLADKRADAISSEHLPELDAETLRELAALGITVDGGIDLVVPSAERRRYKSSSSVTCHVLTAHLPGKTFLRISPHVFVCSPETTFLQMAQLSNRGFPFWQLVVFGFQLCGRYAKIRYAPVASNIAVADVMRAHREVSSTNHRNIVPRPPMSSVVRIRKYLENVARAREGVQNVRGLSRAQKACGFLLEGSASPMETIATIILCAPRQYGGYGFPRPILNCRVELSPAARRATGVDALHCDLVWPELCTAVEIDTREYHGTSRFGDDAVRRNATATSEVLTITAVPRQFCDPQLTDLLAEQIRMQLHLRRRPATKYWIRRRAELRDQLLAYSDERRRVV